MSGSQIPPSRPVIKLGLSAIRVPTVEDKVQDQFNREVGTLSRTLASSPFAAGILLENVEVGTTETKVPHKLDKSPRGYFVLAKTGPGDLWLSQAPSDTYLYILADAPLTVDLWVF